MWQQKQQEAESGREDAGIEDEERGHKVRSAGSL